MSRVGAYVSRVRTAKIRHTQYFRGVTIQTLRTIKWEPAGPQVQVNFATPRAPPGIAHYQVRRTRYRYQLTSTGTGIPVQHHILGLAQARHASAQRSTSRVAVGAVAGRTRAIPCYVLLRRGCVYVLRATATAGAYQNL
jgi:hypothetical protein